MEDSGVRIPAEARKFLFSKTFRLLWRSHSVLFKGDWSFLPVLKRPGSEGGISLHLSTDIKNKWHYSSKTPIRQHGMDRKTFAFSWLVLLRFEITVHSAYLTININTILK